MNTQIHKRGPVRPLAYDGNQAAKALGVSSRMLEKFRDKWGVPYRRLGKRIVYPVKSLENWINGGWTDLADTGEEAA